MDYWIYFYRNLQLLNHVITIKTKVVLSQVKVNFSAIVFMSVSVLVLNDYYIANVFGFQFCLAYLMKVIPETCRT